MAKLRLKTKLCDMLGIDYPILSAGMGPSLIGEKTGAPVELVVAVSEAGGTLDHPVMVAAGALFTCGSRTGKLPIPSRNRLSSSSARLALAASTKIHCDQVVTPVSNRHGLPVILRFGQKVGYQEDDATSFEDLVDFFQGHPDICAPILRFKGQQFTDEA